MRTSVDGTVASVPIASSPFGVEWPLSAAPVQGRGVGNGWTGVEHLELTLFGGFRACLRDGDDVVLASRKAKLLLAYLALQPGEAHSREKICGLLWGDRGEAQARASLRQELLGVRKALASATPSLLVIAGDRLSLDPRALAADVPAFEALMRSDDTRDLERATRLYRGPFLDGIAVRDDAGEQWLTSERERLRELFLGALDRLLSRALESGASHQAGAIAQRLLAHDPLREDAHRTLMRLHAQQGRRSLALKQYRVCRERVGRELGIEPEPATRRLYEEIQQQGDEATPPAGILASAMSPSAAAIEQADGEKTSAASPFEPRPAIAVLPFDGIGDHVHLADGLNEDLTIALARFRQLAVVARHSAFQYRGRRIDVRRIGSELGVDYLVEGSVRRFGGRTRISVQLVNGASGSHVWAERFDLGSHELAIRGDQLVGAIAVTLVGRLSFDHAERIRRRPSASLAACDHVLRGNAMPLGDVQAEARRTYEQAIALDPDCGCAHALLAVEDWLEWGRDMSGSDAALDRALEHAKAAAALDENDSLCQWTLGWIHLHRRSFDLAEEYHRRAIAMNPNHPSQVATMGTLLSYLGRPDEGIAWLDAARRLDRFHPPWHWRHLGFVLYSARRYEEAIAAFNRSPEQPYWVHAYLAACHAHLGRKHRAREEAEAVLNARPEFSLAVFATKEPFKNVADLAHKLDGLRRAELPE